MPAVSPVAPALPSPVVVVNAPLPDRPPDQLPVFTLPEQMQWQKIIPSMGADSPKLTVVRHDPASGATTMLIWTPPNFHVPRHWHTGSEKHLVIRGTFIIECPGRREVLKPGAFNYLPARTVHQAWTTPDEDCLLYTDVDTAWDINWLDLPPGQGG